MYTIISHNIPQGEWKLMFTREQKIEEFLDEYRRSRVIIETTVRAALNKFIEFEDKFRKSFYEFSEEEALKVFTSFHAISIISLQNTNLLLKHASRWMIDKKKLNIKSIYEDITKEQLQTCVDIKKKNSLIFTKEDLEEIQGQLLNYTDKGILTMLFLGAGGKWLKELTFFDMNQMSRSDGVAYFKTGKVIPIDDEVYKLIRRACIEEELATFGEVVRFSRVKSFGIYKQRANALTANDNPNNEDDLARRFRWVQRRLFLISEQLGVHLTSGNVQMSGLLHFIREGMSRNKMDFRSYVKTEEGIELAKRYDFYSNFAPQIIIEKFEQYFKE